MWWMLASCAVAGMALLEARRVLRDRSAEASGPRLYALYAPGHPERALRLVDVDADDLPAPAYAAGSVTPRAADRRGAIGEAFAANSSAAALAAANGSHHRHRSRHRVRT